MVDDLVQVLTRFHREVFIPDLREVLQTEIGAEVRSLRSEMLSHFDAIYQKLDRLETDSQEIRAAVTRLEERMGRVEGRLAVIQETLKIELRQ